MSYTFSREPQEVPRVNTVHRSIQTAIPAPGTAELLARLDRVEPRSMHGQLPIIWDTWTTLGSSVYDLSGNRFIDFTSGIFVANVGHANANVAWAVEGAANSALHSYAYATSIRAKYLERLTQWSGFEKAFLVSSGTEATEAARKLMEMHGRKVGKRRDGIVCFEGAFHGRTLGAHQMSQNFSGQSIYRLPFPYPWTPKADPEAVLASLTIDPKRDLCGFMLETFQGWCAAFYPPDFVQAIEKFCRRHDILLCFDEMQAGFGRTGRKFGYEHYGVTPDLICVGKAMGGGLPLSGVLGRVEILDIPEAGDMSSTHGGNPLCCAAGLAVIEEIERLDLVREAERKGDILHRELAKIGEQHSTIFACNGMGLVAAVLFGNAEFASKVAERCMQKGLLVVATGRESIKIGPPLTIPDETLIEGVGVIGEAIAELSR